MNIINEFFVSFILIKLYFKFKVCRKIKFPLLWKFYFSKWKFYFSADINIERTDINESMENLVSEDFIDSIDIMALVAEIEKFYKKPLKAEFITPENFESFENIKKMLETAMKD